MAHEKRDLVKHWQIVFIVIWVYEGKSRRWYPEVVSCDMRVWDGEMEIGLWAFDLSRKGSDVTLSLNGWMMCIVLIPFKCHFSWAKPILFREYICPVFSTFFHTSLFSALWGNKTCHNMSQLWLPKNCGSRFCVNYLLYIFNFLDSIYIYIDVDIYIFIEDIHVCMCM